MSKKYRISIVLIGGFISIWLYFLFTSTVKQEKGIIYYLRAGTSKQVLVKELSQQGIINHPLMFSLFAYPQKFAQLKTGEYLFPRGSTPFSIWRQITHGTGLYYRGFTIIPGWSFVQLRHALSLTDTLKDTIYELDNKQIMTLLGNPNLAPEGQFFPETYYYTRGVSNLIILKHAFDLMQLRLNQIWNSRANGLPYKNAYEALIAASLIEKEAYLNTERPIIAGVLINRLRKNMLLQIDPTIIYGMGDRYLGKINKENLVEDTIYNTYIHKGLPPTPIAMPSEASLMAAVHPQVHDYYYFVTKGDGSHQFSKTLPEHNAAVQKFVRHQTSYLNETSIHKYIYPILPNPRLSFLDQTNVS